MITNLEIAKVVEKLSDLQRRHYEILKKLNDLYSQKTHASVILDGTYYSIVDELISVKVNRALVRAVDYLEECKKKYWSSKNGKERDEK